MSSIYLHIPFCLTKCHYCDFYSLPWEDKSLPEKAFLKGLKREISLWSSWLHQQAKSPIKTIFFGGGTPSLLSPEGVEEILAYLKSLVPFSSEVEITLELNPKTAGLEKLRAFRQSGIHRISMGLQSLDEQVLKLLGRGHSGEEALQTLQAVSEAGFTNYSLDLMYGLPRQTLKSFEATLKGIQDFDFSHLSAYELIVEKATPFYRWYQQGQLNLPQEEITIQMEETLQTFCESRGLRRYEISNYAKPGEECKHNLVYWNYENFLGLGPGAVGFLKKDQLSEEAKSFWKLENKDFYGLRFNKKKDWLAYAKHADEASTWDLELISLEQARAEFFMMALRKTQGSTQSLYEKHFKEPFPQDFIKILEKYQKRGWIEKDKDRFWLNHEGLRFSQEVMGEFLVG
ncbi:MAG: radical SAM family heme chaperone HemW [Deltaproteobacteria bacterium]|nr:radical SAM family heme chaperone HemW [Deltaproteobacteria bacterium]